MVSPIRHPTPAERAAYHLQLARAHQQIADSPGYRNHPEARAAELREVARCTELAAEAMEQA